MSMLTPPGMGGKYRITGDKYPRMRPRRRRGRFAFGLVAVVAVLALIGWGTWQLIDVFTGGKKASAANAEPDCPTGTDASASPAATVPRPSGITVNVYNATPRTGLAKTTADELKKRGFKIGEVGNAPTQFDQKIKGTGILLGPDSARNTTLPVLATQLGGAERRTDAGRKGTALDLIIGTAFKGLANPADAEKALAALAPSKTTPATSKKNC
ncbi:LytR C-terminal domain-containing protein [Streptomyces sp. NPDC056161]|uniref:LytR C-terminal domain-containing protein n=1 Tax=Streptomyces sp. NPDC056161 TaxID=3345732 RepID=UPI0035DEED93